MAKRKRPECVSGEQFVTSRANGSLRVQFFCKGETKTEQSHAAEVDINQIVSRYKATGVLPTSGHVARFGDFSSVSSYHEAMDQVREAEAMFLGLPSSLRRRFDNDPGELIQFLSDPDNVDEAVELGFLKASVRDSDSGIASASAAEEGGGQGGDRPPKAAEPTASAGIPEGV